MYELFRAKTKSLKEEKTMRNKAFNLVGKTVSILIIILIAVMLFSIIKSKVNKQDTTFLGYRFYVVLSESMKPTFDMGSVVAVKQISPSELAKGDIITFRDVYQTDKTTTHRIVEVKSNNGISFVTKGDANSVNDQSTVSVKDVVGKVAFHIPYIGRLLNFVRTKTGLLLLIIIPSTFVGVYESAKLFSYLRKKQDN